VAKKAEVINPQKRMLLSNPLSDVKYHKVNVTESVKNTNKKKCVNL
jgi:hypothetical protein